MTITTHQPITSLGALTFPSGYFGSKAATEAPTEAPVKTPAHPDRQPKKTPAPPPIKKPEPNSVPEPAPCLDPNRRLSTCSAE